MVERDGNRLTFTLDEHTAAGRVGRDLLACRAALGAARDGGVQVDVERLERLEQALTVTLLREVMVPRWNFGTFGRSAGSSQPEEDSDAHDQR